VIEHGCHVPDRVNNGHGRMPFSEVCGMSALPPKADIRPRDRDVRFGPKAEVLLRRFRMPQGRVELVKRPIYFVAGDHQRGTDTDGVVMGILT
jgi:hypothetical protein